MRETWYDDLEGMRAAEPRPTAPDNDIYYRADGEACRQFEQLDAGSFRWRPSIHMPRWASRITLRVTSVRVERLQAITGYDARAEGIVSAGCPCEPCSRTSQMCPGTETDHIGLFAKLWDEINGKRASWVSNPWVWVVGFEVVR